MMNVLLLVGPATAPGHAAGQWVAGKGVTEGQSLGHSTQQLVANTRVCHVRNGHMMACHATEGRRQCKLIASCGT